MLDCKNRLFKVIKKNILGFHTVISYSPNERKMSIRMEAGSQEVLQIHICTIDYALLITVYSYPPKNIKNGLSLSEK